MTEYTAWHIARLRDRLARYRAVETHNGRTRPWALVARDILDTDGLPKSYWESEGTHEVLAEALRRFVDQKQVPKVERLDAIALFLRSKGYFSDADISETQDGYGAALAMQQLFKTENTGNARLIEGVFTSKRRREPQGSLVSMLEILPVADGGIARIKEALLESSTFIVKEAEFSPARPLRHAGMVWRHAEGWLMPGGQGSHVAFLQERLEGKRQVLVLPLQQVPEEPGQGEGFLIAMKLDQFEPSAAVADAKNERMSIAAAEVANWATSQVWPYRHQSVSAQKRGRRP